MDEQTKRRMIENYFKDFPKWTLSFIFAGALVSFIGAIFESVVAMVIGIIVADIGGFIIYFSFRGKPTDQQIDEWLEADLKVLKAKGLTKMGVKETELVSEPVAVTGLRIWESGVRVAFKKGKDRILRFSPIDVSILNFTREKIMIYNCALDFFTGNVLNERTEEFFYKDVSSIAISTVNTFKVPTGRSLHLDGAETFTVSTSKGTAVSMLLRYPRLMRAVRGVIPIIRAERAVQSGGRLLQEKGIKEKSIETI